MALIDSKQLNQKFTGSFTLSGSIIGDSNTSASFGRIVGTTFSGDGSQLTGITSVTTSSIQNLDAGIVSGSSQVTYDGNRRVLNTKFPTLFSASFNAGTSGSVNDFLDAVFFPNTPPSVSSSKFTIDEFVKSYIC